MFNEIRNTLITSMIDIQESSGRLLPESIDGNTCPLIDLQGFDSLNAVEVTAKVSTELKLNLEPTLMIHSHFESPLTINEITQKLIDLIKRTKAEAKEAEEKEKNEQ